MNKQTGAPQRAASVGIPEAQMQKRLRIRGGQDPHAFVTRRLATGMQGCRERVVTNGTQSGDARHRALGDRCEKGSAAGHTNAIATHICSLGACNRCGPGRRRRGGAGSGRED